ncbi:MAG: T9SS type A sorting domain-containing protein [Saprospiraceae bacterium]
MSGKPVFLLLCLLGFGTLSWSQIGFNKFYNQYSVIDNFARMVIDNDTIICIGIAYDTTISPSPQQILMVKLDTFGNVIQTKLYKDSLNGYLSINYITGDIIQTSDGYFAFAVAVFGRSSMQIIQLDNSLNVKSAFEYSIGDNYNEFYEQILEMPDGGFMIAGNASRPNLKKDGFVRRIDKDGNVLWFKYYGDYDKDESFRCMAKVSDNRIVLGGSNGPDFNNSQTARAGLWAIDSNGVVLDSWVGPNDPNLIVIIGLLPTPDGGFVANGRTYWGEGDWGSMVQVSLLKFDAALELQWLQHIGPNNSGYNGIYDMIPTPDGHYLVAGQRTAYGDLSLPSDDWGGWLYKFSEQGDSIWSRADNAPPGYDATGAFVYGGVGVLSSGSIVAGGKGDIDDKFVGWVVKVTADGCMDTLFCYTSGLEEPSGETGLRVFPNPTTGLIEINIPPHHGGRLVVYNAHGQKVTAHRLASGSLEIMLNLEHQPSGLYWAVFNDQAGKVLGSSRISIQR